MSGIRLTPNCPFCAAPCLPSSDFCPHFIGWTDDGNKIELRNGRFDAIRSDDISLSTGGVVRVYRKNGNNDQPLTANQITDAFNTLLTCWHSKPSAKAIELLAGAAARLGYPTEGDFAAELWRLTSGDILGVEAAKYLMSRCGYKPFCGYPLTRKG